ncbi:unnamed protein product [Rangifer tarandus platyrhynchus]|uniref:Uncharacterized protein n=1 Tax=Rangifer tarandus platyrhynchus TaxID=3082113 RepID=A0ABN8XNE0_RANTA|nr:unnamed protein product [Rangifer tarandus platyrhynchus]
MDAEQSGAETGEEPPPTDAEGLEAEETDVFEEGQDLSGEFGLAEMKSQKAPSSSAEEPRKLEARYDAGATGGKTSSAAELEAATAVGEPKSALKAKDETTHAANAGRWSRNLSREACKGLQRRACQREPVAVRPVVKWGAEGAEIPDEALSHNPCLERSTGRRFRSVGVPVAKKSETQQLHVKSPAPAEKHDHPKAVQSV